MKKYSLTCHFAFCILLLALSLPSPGQGPAETEPPAAASGETSQGGGQSVMARAEGARSQWAAYQVILQRNIFSRQRGPVRPRQPSERPRAVVTPNPESYFLLKGIVQEANTFIAFLEDSRGNGVLRLREGGSVARGIVKNFTLDSIEYQVEDRVISVTLGRDLEGGQGAMTMSRLFELSAGSPAAGGQEGASAEPTLSGDEAEILRRLMEQRKQQLGQ